ncbi:GNAT family N-acetyltransferase [Streptomyces xiamenensis]
MDTMIRAAEPDELTELGEMTATTYLDEGLLTYGAADPYLRVLRDTARRAAHTQILVAADTDGTLLGSVTLVLDGGPYVDVADGPEEAEFRMLVVRNEARGRGIGEALVRECLSRARRAGKRRVVISSSSQMHTAHRLYGRLGFVRAPERDWDPFPGVTLHVFACEL